MPGRFTNFILVAMLIGIIVGYVCHEAFPDPEEARRIASYFSVITDIFLRLIRMIIAPLVLTTLIVGIAHMGDTTSLGRVGAKTLGWFIGASLVSLTLGLIMVNLLQPGVGLNLPLPEADAKSTVSGTALSVRDFITHLVPASIADAMSRNEILQIVIFSIFVGVAVNRLGPRARHVVELADHGANVMLQVTNYVMLAAPLAVFAAVAAVVTTQGIGILVTYGKFMGGFYLSLLILWGLLFLAGFLVVGPRVRRLAPMIKEPLVLAFSTASSEAAYPKTLEQLERYGASKRIASFVLPLGYSFNLDGTMMYCTFATLFIAQAYGMDISFSQQIAMLLLLMITSKGVAGVPRASLVVIAATLVTFGIPEAGMLLILGIDQFLDMGRSATNVVGNAIATTVVAKWEDELKDPQPEVTPEGKLDLAPP